MPQSSRRQFVKAAAIAAPALRASAQSPTDQINVAVVGLHGRGKSHYRAYAEMPNVKITHICDIDERLFPEAQDAIERIAGYRPKTIVDFRDLIKDPDLHAVSLATPDHWHALQTIWACQAGKDVYVEKPVSYTLLEGRKMVDAARKYDRIVQVGLNRRSDPRNIGAMDFIRSGAMGDAYRGKAIIYKGRASIGKERETAIPEGVNWDLYLGPAPYRAFSPQRFHYGWHFFWDTSTTDIGNSGVHNIDLTRRGMKKDTHPVKVHSWGGVYVWDSDQQVPNVQSASLEYADGTILEVELTNLFTPPMDGVRSTAEFLYTTKGYVSSAQGWHSVEAEFVPRLRESPAGIDERMNAAGFPERNYSAGKAIPAAEGESENHWENFIRAVRSRDRGELNCEIEEGHLSTAVCHLANISYRTGRKLVFDPETETFPGDEEANKLLTREYREPYVLPDSV